MMNNTSTSLSVTGLYQFDICKIYDFNLFVMITNASTLFRIVNVMSG